MRIDRCEVVPADDTVDPTLRFNVALEFNPQHEIPLATFGVARSEEGKILGPLSAVRGQDGHKNGAQSWNGPHSVGSRWNSSNQFKTQVTMDCPLSSRALAHILRVRDKNSKKDIVLKIEVDARVLRPEVEMASVVLQTLQVEIGQYESPNAEKEAVECLTYKYTPGERPHNDRSGLSLVSANSSGELARVETTRIGLPKPIHIKASDWVADFCPIFGVGNFIQIELPRPYSPPMSGPLAERLSEAAEALERMKGDIQQGEWEDCLAAARPVYELLNDRKALESLFADSGIPYEAGQALIGSISGLFQYTSKFIHRVGRGENAKVQALPPAHKEDALLIYSNAVTLVNMLGQKLRRQNQAS